MILLLTLSLIAATPDTLTLDRSYEEAVRAYPLRQQIATLASIETLRSRNITARYLPTVSVSGTAVYHSDVAEIALPTAGTALPSPANDQYKLAIGVDQLVYDGGVTAGLRALEELQRDLEQGSVEVELFGLYRQVNTAYFGALAFESQTATLRSLKDDLSARLEKVRALVRNGTVLRSNAEVLQAEILDLEQQMAEAQAGRRTALDVLGELVGGYLADETVLVLPDLDTSSHRSAADARPELRVFDLRRSVLAQQSKLVTSRNLPLVSAFAEGAYGRPAGLDLFETDFKPFYTVGLRVTWRAWSWRTPSRERQILRHQRDLIDAQEGAFRRQTSIAGYRHLNDIRRLQEQLDRDDEVIRLRERIAAEAASRLQNGTITSTDYITEKNAENRARLQQHIHRIELARARAEYLITIGKP